jgi:hypothetical protein
MPGIDMTNMTIDEQNEYWNEVDSDPRTCSFCKCTREEEELKENGGYDCPSCVEELKERQIRIDLEDKVAALIQKKNDIYMGSFEKEELHKEMIKTIKQINEWYKKRDEIIKSKNAKILSG